MIVKTSENFTSFIAKMLEKTRQSIVCQKSEERHLHEILWMDLVKVANRKQIINKEKNTFSHFCDETSTHTRGRCLQKSPINAADDQFWCLWTIICGSTSNPMHTNCERWKSLWMMATIPNKLLYIILIYTPTNRQAKHYASSFN